MAPSCMEMGAISLGPLPKCRPHWGRTAGDCTPQPSYIVEAMWHYPESRCHVGYELWPLQMVPASGTELCKLHCVGRWSGFFQEIYITEKVK